MAKGKKAGRQAPTNVRGPVKAKPTAKTRKRPPGKGRGASPGATSARLRAKIVALMVENPEMTLADMALELRISALRVQAYVTESVRRDVEILRLKNQNDPTLEEIDLAMRRQARLGNVQAARLVYLRSAQQEGHTGVPTLEDLEAELASLKNMERAKETENDAGLGDAAALADDTRR